MTITEASKKYHIPLDILREYEALIRRETYMDDAENWECSYHDLDMLNLLILLHASEFTTEEVKAYVEIPPKPKEILVRRLQMLNQKRGQMLDEIHRKEDQLDHLDYLRYELQKETASEAAE